MARQREKTMKKQHKRILVISAPRSGTRWMARILRECKLDVRHEWMGKDGSVSSYFVVDTDEIPIVPQSKRLCHQNVPGSSAYRFDLILHVTRHPVKTIASMRGVIGTDTQQWMFDNKLSKANVDSKV